MSPSEYRVALIRLLAEIDQQVCNAEEWAFKPDLSDDARKLAVVQLEFRRRAAVHVEGMLAAFDAPNSADQGDAEATRPFDGR